MFLRFGVVSRRSDDSKSVADFTSADGLASLNYTSA